MSQIFSGLDSVLGCIFLVEIVVGSDVVEGVVCFAALARSGVDTAIFPVEGFPVSFLHFLLPPDNH